MMSDVDAGSQCTREDTALLDAERMSTGLNAEERSETSSDNRAPKCIQKLQRLVAGNVSKEACAEFSATFILMMFGIGSVSQHVLSEGDFGQFLSVNIAWGIGVALGCYVAGAISGAHMNPAISVAMAVYGRLPWRQVPVYVASQMLGSFTASVLCFAVYYDALENFSGSHRDVSGQNATAEIWATYNQPFVSVGVGFLDQVVGTGLLALSVFAITDERNWAPPDYAKPLAIGATVVAIGASFGYNTGYAINPARDLAPRIFTAIAGWGKDVFTYGPYWFWVPVFACTIGAVLGSGFYVIVIESHHHHTARTSSTSTR
ncbi:aquaporin-9-like [Sycon ciliatum]|uniref:aquaporin-9-like n=1 Tax=Sycon ciliatum TaxID=27933 RepID=UPI0031F6D9E3